MTVSCGWRLADVRVPRDGRTTVKASLPGTVADDAALHAWLDEAATATNTAVSDPQVRGTTYPAQRLKGISVTTPARTVSQSPLPITLLPVWPSGTDTLNPLYQSPSSGSPSQLLQDIAGGESSFRFSDSCGSAVAVSSDGLTVTALSITPECRLRASVGNFTDLESTPFQRHDSRLTTREPGTGSEALTSLPEPGGPATPPRPAHRRSPVPDARASRRAHPRSPGECPP